MDFRSPSIRRRFAWILALGLVVAVAVAFWAADSGKTGRTAGGSRQSRKKRRQDLLEKSIEMVQPDVLRVETKVETVISLLNDWGRLGEGDQAAADPLWQQLLDEPQRKLSASDQFSARDITHIRDALWYKAVGGFIGRNADSELDRIVALFEYVVRNVVLVDDPADALPAHPFDVALLGRGTARDRAWLFANLMRARRLDSVILLAGRQGEVHSASWLVGVLLDGQVYLFDPRLGLPIPADGEQPRGPMVTRPATLAEVLKDDRLLVGSADEQHPYPVGTEELGQSRVQVIGTSSYWSPRMRRLQGALAGEQAVLLSDALGPSEVNPRGLVDRVGEVGTSSKVTVWPYPERQLDAFEQLTPTQAARRQLQFRSFDVPKPVFGLKRDPGSRRIQQVVFGVEQRKHLGSRQRQLLGDFGEAIKSYVPTATWEKVPPLPKDAVVFESERESFWSQVPDRIRRMYSEAGDEAIYWIAICQVEQGDHRAAAETLARYLSRRPRRFGSAAWKAPARWQLAISLARTSRLDEAITVLSGGQPDPAQQAGREVLLRRWRELVKRGDAAEVPPKSR